MIEKTCYMCNEIAVSDEHVPPKCIFPKTKDLPAGVDYRKELITVPSCVEHNSDKSTEDQYFFNVLVACEQINEVGREHYRRQVRRQFALKSSILNRFANRSIEIDDRLGFKVEIDRLDVFVGHLGRALYYAQFGRRWDGDLGWFPEFLSRATDFEAEALRLAAIDEIDLEFKDAPVYGANPRVFFYQVLKTREHCKLRLHFYEGCRILLTF